MREIGGLQRHNAGIKLSELTCLDVSLWSPLHYEDWFDRLFDVVVMRGIRPMLILARRKVGVVGRKKRLNGLADICNGRRLFFGVKRIYTRNVRGK